MIKVIFFFLLLNFSFFYSQDKKLSNKNSNNQTINKPSNKLTEEKKVSSEKKTKEKENSESSLENLSIDTKNKKDKSKIDENKTNENKINKDKTTSKKTNDKETDKIKIDDENINNNKTNKKKKKSKRLDKNIKEKNKQNLKSFNIYSPSDEEIYSLASISFSEEKKEDEKISIDFKKFIITQITKTNQTVIENIYRYFLAKNKNIFQDVEKKINKGTKRDILLYFLNKKIDEKGNLIIAKKSKGKSVSTQKLKISRNLGGGKNQIILNNATLFNFYEISKGSLTNKVADLVGDVEVEYQDIIISADRIRVNITSEILVARGNILIQIKDKKKSDVVGKTFFFDIKANKGLVINAKGRHEKYYYNGEKLKMNDTEHFTLEKGNISFGDNSHIYYSIALDHFNFYDNDDFFLEGFFYRVHNHPFLWLPAFFQTGKISTSLDFNFGRSEREGYYVLVNNFNLVTPFFTPVNLQFQLAERLGFLLKFKNQGSEKRVNYNIDTGVGYYYKNVNTSRFPLRYTYHDALSDTLFSEFGNYLKLKYNIKILSENGVNSRVNFQIDKFSKPYFISIFKNNSSFPKYEIEKLYDKDENEQYYNATGRNKDRYKINYSLSSSAINLKINNDWVHDIYEDPELPEEDEEKYISYLKTFIFPDVSISHSGFIDLFKISENENFNLNYNVGFKYSIISKYKDGQKKGDGRYYTNIAPFKLINKEDSLSANAGTSKSFSFDFGTNRYLNWVTFSFSPSINWQYSIKKETEKNDTTKYPGKNITRNYYNWSLGSSLNILKNKKFFFDLGITSSLNYNLENFQYREDINLGLLDDQIKGRSSKYSFTLSGTFSFPSGKLISQWRNSYGYLSSLPTLSLGLSYNLAKYNQKITNDNIFFFPLHSSKSINGNIKIQQRGYGFLFIKNLDSDFSSSLSGSYDMKPTINSDNEEEKVVLDEKLFRNVSGGSTFNLNYFQVFKLNNSFSYDFYDISEKKFFDVTNVMKTYAMTMSLVMGTNIIDNDIISFKSLNVNYSWNYNFRPNQYLQDKMAVSLNMNLNFFSGLLNLTLSTSLNNTESYLYFNHKVENLGLKQINLFEDLINLVNIFDITQLQKSLFKFNGVSIAFKHDLREWFMSFSYNVSPVALNNVGSLKGFYLNQRIALDINLKPQFNPIDGGGKFIPVDELEETITPKEFKN